MRVIIGGLVLGVALAATLLWSTLVDPAVRIPGSYPDGAMFFWNVSWIREALCSGASLYVNSKIFHPFGSDLHLHTLAEGLLVPVAWLGGGLSVHQLYLLAVVLALIGNAAAWWIACRAIMPKRELAAAATALLMVHPFVRAHLDGGHLNFVFTAPAALTLGGIIRLCYGGNAKWWRWAALTAGAAAWTAFVNLYHCVYLVTFAVVIMVHSVCLGREVVPLISRLLLAGIGATILSGWHVLNVAAKAQSQAFTANHNPARHSADLLSLLLPSSNQVLGTISGLGPWIDQISVNSAESGVALGLATLALSALLVSISHIGTWHRATVPLFLCAGLSWTLSLGGTIRVGGSTVVDNPLVQAVQQIPMFPSVPIRWAWWGWCCFILANLGVAHGIPFQNLSRVRAKILYLLCLAELFPSRLASQEIRTSPVLELLKSDAKVGAIYDVGSQREYRLSRQVFHGRAVTEVFLARRPKQALKAYRQNPMVQYLEQGSANPPEHLLPSWRSLRCDQLLVPRNQRETLERAISIPWLQVIAEDQHLVLLAPLPRSSFDDGAKYPR